MKKSSTQFLSKLKNLIMNPILQEKLRESLSSVLPITGVVLFLCFFVTDIDGSAFMLFFVGAILLILGMGLFSLGSEMAMTPIGQSMGASVAKSRHIWPVCLVCFILGTIITIAEPDLQVLAEQVPSINNWVLILAVATGVGMFLVIAVLRILFHVRLSILLTIFYIIVFALAAVLCMIRPDFLAVAFDSGGVTTGPMTVPFIMAFGVGIASMRHDKDADSDSFGLVALCSVGPILAVMILGLLVDTGDLTFHSIEIPEISTTRELGDQFWISFPEYAKEVAMAILPIAIFFILYQITALHLPKRQLIKIAIGLGYTYIGLVLFLTGVNVGFMPAGNLLGQQLASGNLRWLMVPIGMLIGYFVVSAEPAVHVLNKQVEEITDGVISQRSMMMSMSIGVAVSLGLSMIRVLTGISIMWFLVPGYLIAIVLSFLVPKIFMSIAFDSGGVASGPMTATFLLPFAMGACEALGGNIITDAFGIVAMVAMTPLITIQLMGYLYQRKTKRTVRTEAPILTDTIISFEVEEESV